MHPSTPHARKGGPAPAVRLSVFRDADLSPAGSVAADLVEAAVPFVAAHPEIAALAARCPQGVEVAIRCASISVFDEWQSVTPDALGFFATLNILEVEYELEGEDDLVGMRTEFDVPERLEVVVVADRMAEFVDPSMGDADVDLRSWLETLAHEVCHALAWAAATGGRPPLEVFDDGFGGTDGEDALVATARAAELVMEEDDVEEACRRITGSVPLGVLDGALSRLAAVTDSPAPR